MLSQMYNYHQLINLVDVSGFASLKAQYISPHEQ